MIQGGDNYIASAYAFAYTLLVSYGLALAWRRKRAQRDLQHHTEVQP